MEARDRLEPCRWKTSSHPSRACSSWASIRACAPTLDEYPPRRRVCFADVVSRDYNARMAPKKKPSKPRATVAKTGASQRTAGVRDLKAHFSAYLRRVRDGETVTITDRGAVIAQLTPPPPLPPEDEMERTLVQLERTGQIVRPTLTMTQLRSRLQAGAKSPAARRGATQRILDEDREDRF
jgi:prevent-host-death family protein